ncbi:radical SAM family heme chaperone HemW [Propionispora vibrioides]|uniref:Heme chaperone HemW n=1 Tax=Propionispora vibrioides TaxID=112903 RepID=A0A1H8NUF1_9FIRM|nr:radical SAM family heme chaperone HemW [Propionispora vibrioides]SEO33152.1 oxygen-independent coproporphyrinogen-3 oxidase [Propionispora vibrioides]
MKLGIYVHIPFCRQKCLYCDFPSFTTDSQLYSTYITALCREATGRSGIFSHAVVDTVFIGGGTPTLLSQDLLNQILSCLRENYRLSDEVEITIEANPGTVDRAKLQTLQAQGVNRISFGVQTFAERLLPQIGRIHSAAEAARAVELAQAAGFDNINVDLMYGLPEQTVQDLQESIDRAIGMGVRHLSVYGLKIEEGTPFASLHEQGRLALPEEEIEEAMYELAVHYLPARGFRRYEISNYAPAGWECRHNLKYWHYQPYLGLGLAAHSFFDGQRLANTVDLQRYIDFFSGTGGEKQEFPVAVVEKLDRETAMAEFAFLALRTSNGVHILEFNTCFAADFFSQYNKVITALRRQELIEVTEKNVRLTELGMKYGNVVFGAFLPDT